MNIMCVLRFHKWKGCECARCGRSSHKWEGCKCVRCGSTRYEGHDWKKLNDECNQCIWCKQLRAPRLPDLTKPLADFDLFQRFDDKDLAPNVMRMFQDTRSCVGGRIRLVNLIFENGIVLSNVRIANERTVSIPANYGAVQITSVAVPNLERQIECQPMTAGWR
jgi:hypothetical protein